MDAAPSRGGSGGVAVLCVAFAAWPQRSPLRYGQLLRTLPAHPARPLAGGFLPSPPRPLSQHLSSPLPVVKPVRAGFSEIVPVP